jgi:chromosome partitioning protein
MRTIAIVNQKGGCGKTITAINLSAFLARNGHRVLLVDMDPQGHATLGLLKEPDARPGTMYDVFVRASRSEPARLGEIVRPALERLDLAAADVLLSAAPATLAQIDGREYVLATALDEVRDRYDFVIVDCPPHVGLLTFNALYACSEAIVPMEPSFFSLHGLGKVLETFDLVAKHSGHSIAARVLVTLFTGRSPFARAVVDNMRTHMPGRHFETVVRYSIKLAEAASHGVPITEYSRTCAGFEDYRALAAEVLGRDVSEAAVKPAVDEIRADEVPVEEIPAAHQIPVAAANEIPELVSQPDSYGAVHVEAHADDRGYEPARALDSPSITPDGVMFSLEAPSAASVQLVGDFNQWVVDGNEMEPSGPIWRKLVKLDPGRYRYRFVVDGEWRSDPRNGVVEPCPYGGHDSVVVLQPATSDSSRN